MKEIQTPRNHQARSFDPANRRLKDSRLKNLKIAKKSLNAAFSDVSSLENTKDPMDSAPIHEISEVIPDYDAESFVQASSPDHLCSPQTFDLTDLSPISTLTSLERNVNVSVSAKLRPITELLPAVRSLRLELNELKKLIDTNSIHEERDRMDELVSTKIRVVFLCSLLWILVVAITLFFGSGDQVSSTGPLPT